MRWPRSLPLLSSKPDVGRRPILVRRVAGVSMEPYAGPGAVVVAFGVFRKLRAYDVVIIRQNGLEKIKRILKIRDGQLFVVGDNPRHSTDSRHFGWIPRDHVVGKVIWPH